MSESASPESTMAPDPSTAVAGGSDQPVDISGGGADSIVGGGLASPADGGGDVGLWCTAASAAGGCAG
jgi:hypothetical protein